MTAISPNNWESVFTIAGSAQQTYTLTNTTFSGQTITGTYLNSQSSSYNFNNGIFYPSTQTPAQTIVWTTYSGAYGHQWEVNLWNGNTRWVTMTSQTTANYYIQ